MVIGPLLAYLQIAKHLKPETMRPTHPAWMM
jgi:hypothetical protein